MKALRGFVLLLLLVIVAGLSWYLTTHRPSAVGEQITVYYTKLDGGSEVPWTVSMRPQQPGESAAEHLRNAVLYAATQAIAGPPTTISAIRFPAGTHVLDASVNGSTAQIDLSKEVTNQAGGVLGESGAFKALVWTLTSLPGIDQVAIRVEGQQLETLPGGHLELDEPLRRSDW